MISFQAALRQVLRKFAVASNPSGTRAEIQRVYTGLGAEFGARIKSKTKQQTTIQTELTN